MKRYWDKIKSFIFFDTYGYIASASFLICVVSGIFLAIPFDVADPYNSIAYILLSDQSASFFRNIHYWSAQLFLVFSIIHIWDHFRKNSETKIKKGIWLRLTISILFIFYVMLSGFILKGDIDSLQAKRILSSLVDLIPLIGSTLTLTFLGPENDFQILYVQHIATATIFLVIIIFEHAKTIWTKISTALYTLIIIGLSLLITPGLHDGLSPIIKGPWYFLGLQEILHWITYPEIVLIFVTTFFVIIYFIRSFNKKWNTISKSSIVNLFLVYFFITLFAYFFRGENWSFYWPWNNPYFKTTNVAFFSFTSDVSDTISSKDFSKVLDRYEGCIVCHTDVKGFSPSHSPAVVGCSTCHLGNPFSLNKVEAHKGMVLIAGSIELAEQTCGNADCHPGIPERVNKSIMSTLSGMISVNKYVFGEIEEPTGFYDVKMLGHTSADTHLRNLCISCHIDNVKEELGPIDELSRGGGCSACHLNYSENAKIELDRIYFSVAKPDSIYPKYHPSLDLNITNDHCFGCHSRSGRISTNYEGWHETLLEPQQVKSDTTYRILHDERVFEFVEADVHHQAGMQCIDCHTSYEVMGDGNEYQHKEEQVKIECIDCHSKNLSNRITIKQFDNEAMKIAKLRSVDVKDRVFLSAHKTGQPLINTFVDEENNAKLITKLTAKTLDLKPPVSVCSEGTGHERLSCNTCHTSWAPQCIGCHTDYDPTQIGFDLLKNEDTEGVWEEHVGVYFAEPPVLGVKIINDSSGTKNEIIDTFIPGMILTVNKNMSGKKENIIFKRLYSPAFSHTIQKEVRSCESCHNSSLAIGYGRGKLNYEIIDRNGFWKFIPKFASNEYDGLPEDAWIGFLTERTTHAATRENMRPFTIDEQRRILTVGTCLTCHDSNSNIMKNSVTDFDKLSGKVSAKCVLPVW